MGEREVRLVRSGERRSPPEGQTPGMAREEAFSDDGAWAGIVRTEPGMVSGWHHHGQHETYIYLLSGRARMDFGPGGEQSIEATADDFVSVPPGLVHRESNPGDEEAVALVVRRGSGPPVVNVEGPEPR